MPGAAGCVAAAQKLELAKNLEPPTLEDTLPR